MSESASKKPGNRQPSPRLHRITQRWTAEEWRQFVAFARIFGNGSHQLRLLEYLRGMTERYDPASEREAFREQNLVSLRYHAIKYSYNTGRRLDFIHHYDLVMMHGNIQLAIQKASYDDAAEFLAEALELATVWEDFNLMAMFLQQERAIIAGTLTGSARTIALQRNATAAQKNAHHLELANEVVQAWAMLAEPLRNKFIETGAVDQDGVNAYFCSSFWAIPIDVLPVSLQIERHRMDELMHYLLGDHALAAKEAEAILAIYERHAGLLAKSPTGHSKVLKTLATYYSELGRFEDGLRIIAYFEKQDPSSEGKRQFYLQDYVFILLQFAIDHQDQRIVLKAMGAWDQNKAFLESLPRDMMQNRLLLAIASFYVARRDVANANQLLRSLIQQDAKFSQETTQAMFMLLRVILLLEDEDQRGLGSIGLSIERKLLAQAASTSPTLEIVRLLKRKGNLEDKGLLRESLGKIQLLLQSYAFDEKFKRALWYPQLIQWISAKMHA
jgi:hypothetical protein